MDTSSEWFATWFDTSYYHILYKNRDYKEAQLFMSNLVEFLKLKKDTSILDLACGKGRHSIFLNSLGYEVTGADLSKNSIDFANQSKSDSLNFIVHDMRDELQDTYHAIFSMFTSFGYFEDDNEDIKVLRNIKKGLKDSDSVFVLDFLNTKKAIKNMVTKETKIIDGIIFNINRCVENGFIIKKIEVVDDNQTFHFFERVKCLDLEKLSDFFSQVGFKIKHIIGDYNMQNFDENNSDRLILIATK